MKEKRIVLCGPSQYQHLLEVLNDVELDGSTEAIVRDARKNRSYRQNRTYFMWVGIIAKVYGNTTDEQHEIFKRRYLVPILQETSPEFFRLSKIIDDHGDESHRKELARRISTTRLDTKQFSRLLDEVNSFANGENIMLPQPL